jgi:hypothetical protein
MEREKTEQAIASVIDQPAEPGLLFVGFKAWSIRAPGQSAEALRERLAPLSTRVVWDVPDGRLALTATEYDSLDAALRALVDHLEANQLAEVPAGPEELGEASFVHPPQAPPAAFFVRGNLVLVVASFGSTPVDVLPLARDVDGVLASHPEEYREDGIDVEQEGGIIRAQPRWGGPDAYLKFMAPGAVLRKRDGAAEVEGDTEDLAVYVVELGRETYGRRLR